MDRCRVEDIEYVLVDKMLVKDYGSEAMGSVRAGVRHATNLMRGETKQTANVYKPEKWKPMFLPKRSPGTFKAHIATRQGRDTPTSYSRIWYVKSPEYRLTHLLEHGHRLYIYGRYTGKRTRAFGFVGNARDNAEQAFLKYLKEHL